MPTPYEVVDRMLDVAKVRTGDIVYDLGCGDGRMVIAAAKKFGTRGVGVDLDPARIREARANAKQAGVDGLVTFRVADMFQTDIREATVVMLYLLPELNRRLKPKLFAELRPGARVVSHDWDMGDWKPDRTLSLAVPEKKVGLEKVSRVHLWIVPARVDGAWCGTGKARGTRLDIAQAFQKFEARVGPDPQLSFEGRIEGAALRGPSGIAFTFDGQQIHNTHASGRYAALHGARFRPLRGAACK